MPAPKSSARYKVSQPIHGVKMEAHPGSSLPNPTETLIKIPVGSLIELAGRLSPSGLINVLWNGDMYSIFFDDLQEKAQTLEQAAS